jgi:histidine phosphotransfer protein HptB
MIDWDRVTELRSEIGAEGFAEVVALFLEEADEVVTRLAVVSGAKALENALHFLKGSALNLGFSDLSRLCQEAERLAAAGDGAIDLCAVTRCYAASKTAFETGLDRLGAIRAA